jgi:hypothetical protein
MGRLYQIQHDLPGRLWCGPAALSAATGKPTSVIVETLRKVTGRDRIMGLHTNEMVHALRMLGYARSDWQHVTRTSFAQFRKSRASGLRAETLIVGTTTHFVVLAGNRLVDNRYRDPIWASDYHQPRARVSTYIIVRKGSKS